jgi:hypothetical protein
MEKHQNRSTESDKQMSRKYQVMFEEKKNKRGEQSILYG